MRRPSFAIIILTAVGAGILYTVLEPPGGPPSTSTGDAEEACLGLTPEECRELMDSQALQEAGDPGGGRGEVVLNAEEVCVSVGYLCSEVERAGELRILRWPAETPQIRVWIPEPQGLPPASARELQRAVARGIQVWHNHPFPLAISTRSISDSPDITIRWVHSLGGNRLGQAQMQWRRTGEDVEVRIPNLVLVTHHPSRPNLPISPEEIQLVAAHEMGHALGLPHSDDTRDLMYPQNTAWRPTQRDYRTMEALYRFSNGVLIRP